jgi:hypothetical protein
MEYVPGILAIGLNAFLLIRNLLYKDRPWSFEDIALMIFQGVFCVLLGFLWYNIWRMRNRHKRDMEAIRTLDLTEQSPNVTPMPPEINTRAKPFTAWYRKLRPGDLSGKLYPDVAYRRNAMFSSILGHYAVNEWKG